MSDVHGSAAEIVGKGNNARGRRGDRDVVQLAKGERVLELRIPKTRCIE